MRVHTGDPASTEPVEDGGAWGAAPTHTIRSCHPMIYMRSQPQDRSALPLCVQVCICALLCRSPLCRSNVLRSAAHPLQRSPLCRSVTRCAWSGWAATPTPPAQALHPGNPQSNIGGSIHHRGTCLAALRSWHAVDSVGWSASTPVAMLPASLNDGQPLRVVWRAQRCQRGAQGLAPVAGGGAPHPQPHPAVGSRRFFCTSSSGRCTC